MPEQASPDRRRIFVFDVNETLLDIEALAPLFERLVGDRRALREWFVQLILYSEAITLAGAYEPFGQLGAGVLRMVAATKGVEIHEPDLDELRSRMQAMPAHPEAPTALARLREAGFRMVTLTNSARQPEGGPLERAGIAAFFERQFSVDQVRRYKPAPETYRMGAQALGVGTDGLWVVACHVWDTIGAQRAGCAGAFVQRPGNAPCRFPPCPNPTWSVRTCWPWPSGSLRPAARGRDAAAVARLSVPCGAPDSPPRQYADLPVTRTPARVGQTW